jgi:hypothetical protein
MRSCPDLYFYISKGWEGVSCGGPFPTEGLRGRREMLTKYAVKITRVDAQSRLAPSLPPSKLAGPAKMKIDLHSNCCCPELTFSYGGLEASRPAAAMAFPSGPNAGLRFHCKTRFASFARQLHPRHLTGAGFRVPNDLRPSLFARRFPHGEKFCATMPHGCFAILFQQRQSAGHKRRIPQYTGSSTNTQGNGNF